LNDSTEKTLALSKVSVLSGLEGNINVLGNDKRHPEDLTVGSICSGNVIVHKTLFILIVELIIFVSFQLPVFLNYFTKP
jgi:hypothetical protein